MHEIWVMGQQTTMKWSDELSPSFQSKDKVQEISLQNAFT